MSEVANWVSTSPAVCYANKRQTISDLELDFTNESKLGTSPWLKPVRWAIEPTGMRDASGCVANNLTQAVDGLLCAILVKMPVGPAIAGIKALHQRTHLVNGSGVAT